ncbi:hypothetical protein EV702DRAFT_1043718 [Suillus placidus]|uniref:Uncharacterized protein n=1 Tax=Suillus placidus TaxID=48579 RepID=A0A9P6ZZT3_9AGAM|nr:hypothetical protein EV702DRAFT_1043718 [Suillus placidus]
MSRLTSYFFSDGADDDPITPVVESYPLNELRPAAAMHTSSYISNTIIARTSLGDEFGMDLFDNPGELLVGRGMTMTSGRVLSPMMLSIYPDFVRQNRMVLGIREAEQEARTEQDILLAYKDAFFRYEDSAPEAARSRLKTHETPIENFTVLSAEIIRPMFGNYFTRHSISRKMTSICFMSLRRAKPYRALRKGLGMGPDPLELHWDMTDTHNSKWNQDILARLRRTDWPQDLLIPGEKPSLVCSAMALVRTMKEVGDRLMDQTNERLRVTRVLTRRATKFETRKKVTSALLSDRIATGKDDQAVWAYLQSLVETLGKDGMSSDESEHEDGEVQVFHLKKMPWRADVDHEMHIIDQQRLAGAANFTPRGSKPAKRFRNAIQESSRPAIEGLPRALYNSSWLNAQSPSFTVSDKKLQRMEIILSR